MAEISDADIHAWLAEDDRNRTLLTDEEIQELIVAYSKGNPDFSLDEVHYFLNWCVRQLVGASLVGLTQKGMLIPVREDGGDFSWEPATGWSDD